MENENKLISNIIRQRIILDNKRFHCNDNIAEYIQEGELDLLVDEVADKFEDVLDSLIIDIDHDHNTHDTARRVAKMMVLETFSGRYRPVPKVTAFPNMGYKSLYLSLIHI